MTAHHWQTVDALLDLSDLCHVVLGSLLRVDIGCCSSVRIHVSLGKERERELRTVEIRYSHHGLIQRHIVGVVQRRKFQHFLFSMTSKIDQ